MEGKTPNTKQILDEVEQVVLIRLEILKLKLIGKSSEMMAVFMSNLIVLLSLVLFLVFLSVALALAIGDWLGNPYYGFLCIAVLFGMLWVVLHWFKRNWLKRKITDATLSQIFEDDEQ